MIFEDPPKPTATTGATPNRDRPRAPVTLDAAAEPDSDPRPTLEAPAADPAPWFRPEPEAEPELGSQAPDQTATSKPRSLTPWLIAVVALAAVGAVALAWPYLTNDGPDVAAFGDRQAALEKRLVALESRPAPTADPAVGSLSQRIDALEKKPVVTPDALAALERRIAGAEAAARQAQSAAESARNAAPSTTPVAPAPVTPPVDLGPLNERVAALDARVGRLEGALNAAKSTERVTEAKIEAGSATSGRAGVAVVVQALTQALERGAPFGDEVTALKTLGVDSARLAPLESVAAKGVPTVAQLRASFATIASRLAAQPPAASETGLFDRLAASARRLVKIERVGEGAPAVGSSGQVDAALARGDVAAALEAWKTLPQPERDASLAWRASAQARLDAETAARALMAESVKSLGGGKP